jgi:crotonobetainyl-CoA:carnitine CoA-transferase CaiB-like acyl-CoA transferase
LSDYPLAGQRFVELSERGSAAFAGKLLRRLGADVTKVEPPSGDPLRRKGSPRHEKNGRTTTPAFDYFNEGKTVRITEDPAELAELVRGADGFLLDLELQRYDAWGLAPDRLRDLGSRLVCAISPFGLTGPYARFQGPEIVTSAFGGMSVGIGEAHREPIRMPLMQTAIQSGLIASIATLGALVDPPTDDATRVVDISETDVWATVHAGTTMVAFLFSNRMRRRAGHRVLGQPYPHQLFRCKDGWIAVQASETHQFNQFVEMVGSPDFIVERQFGTRMAMNNEHADEIDERLAPWFLARTREEIFAECRRRRIPAAPVHSVAEARADDALNSRGCLETYTGATGVDVTVPVPPLRFASAELRPAGPVPTLGGSDAA